MCSLDRDMCAVHAAVSVHTVAGAMSSAQPGHTWMLVAAVYSEWCTSACSTLVMAQSHRHGIMVASAQHSSSAKALHIGAI